MLKHRRAKAGQITGRLVTVLVPLLLATPVLASAPRAGDPADLTLKGDQDGTVFHSLTVEGESRVRIRFERPELHLAIDPGQAPGLQLNDAQDILDRTLPDMVTPFLQLSTVTASPYTPHPGLADFKVGTVAHFTTDMTGVADWKLQVVDSRGETAMVFAGQGNPPPEIAWDGVRLDGTPAPPGYTYSYILEARDVAGNQRRFLGDGFKLPAYRRDDPTGPEFLFSGAQLAQSRAERSQVSSLLLEAATWCNLRCEPTRDLRVIVTHRSGTEAARLAREVTGSLTPLIGGRTGRVVVETQVASGAPASGTVQLTAKP